MSNGSGPCTWPPHQGPEEIEILRVVARVRAMKFYDIKVLPQLEDCAGTMRPRPVKYLTSGHSGLTIRILQTSETQ